MLDRILENVDRKLAYKLMVLHIIIIAISNYIVQFKIDIAGYPLAVAAFTFPLVVVLTDLTVRLLGKQTGRAVIASVYSSYTSKYGSGKTRWGTRFGSI